AEAARQPALADLPPDDGADLRDDARAGEVAVAIVHLLDAIDVQDEQRERLVAAFGGHHAAHQLEVELAPREQARELILVDPLEHGLVVGLLDRIVHFEADHRLAEDELIVGRELPLRDAPAVDLGPLLAGEIDDGPAPLARLHARVLPVDAL